MTITAEEEEEDITTAGEEEDITTAGGEEEDIITDLIITDPIMDRIITGQGLGACRVREVTARVEVIGATADRARGITVTTTARGAGRGVLVWVG